MESYLYGTLYVTLYVALFMSLQGIVMLFFFMPSQKRWKATFLKNSGFGQMTCLSYSMHALIRPCLALLTSPKPIYY